MEVSFFFVSVTCHCRTITVLNHFIYLHIILQSGQGGGAGE